MRLVCFLAAVGACARLYLCVCAMLITVCREMHMRKGDVDTV